MEVTNFMTNKEIAKKLSNDEVAKWLVHCSENEKDCCDKCVFNGIDFYSTSNDDDCFDMLMREAAIRISVLNG